MGKKLSLQLDHINGIHDDNRLENLRILCPNCHAQTETFCGKNVKPESKREKKKYYCGICGIKEIWNSSKNCKECDSIKNRKVKDRPSIETLEEELKKSNYLQLGKKYGVCDNTIRKWMGKRKPTKKKPEQQPETMPEPQPEQQSEEQQTEPQPEQQSEEQQTEKQKEPEPQTEMQVEIKLESKNGKKKYFCGICGIKEIWNTSKNCKECDSFIHRKVKDRPSRETLEEELKTTSYLQLGKKYGVSDNAIRKWLKKP